MGAVITLTLNPALDVSAETHRVEPTIKIRCSDPKFDPGGGGINVARVATRLGADAIAIFPAGGSTGDSLRLLLDREAVHSVMLPISGWTRESIVVNELSTGLQYRIVFPGPELSPADQSRLLKKVCAASAKAPFLVLSGSIPRGPTTDFFAQLRRSCVASRTRLIVDTSGAGLRLAAGPGVYLLKPNREELSEAVGKILQNEQDEVDAARGLIAQNWAEVVLVSLGPGGALLVSATSEERVPPVPVQARSAVGAGDSMVAAIVVGLSRGFTLSEAVRLGVAAGAAALMTAGTELAREDDVERLYGAGAGCSG